MFPFCSSEQGCRVEVDVFTEWALSFAVLLPPYGPVSSNERYKVKSEMDFLCVTQCYREGKSYFLSKSVFLLILSIPAYVTSAGKQRASMFAANILQYLRYKVFFVFCFVFYQHLLHKTRPQVRVFQLPHHQSVFQPLLLLLHLCRLYPSQSHRHCLLQFLMQYLNQLQQFLLFHQ